MLLILDPTEDTTLTNLVADFALIATPEGWTDLLDLLVGSLIVCLRLGVTSSSARLIANRT